jgi:hypothetical protein
MGEFPSSGALAVDNGLGSIDCTGREEELGGGRRITRGLAIVVVTTGQVEVVKAIAGALVVGIAIVVVMVVVVAAAAAAVEENRLKKFGRVNGEGLMPEVISSL